MSTARTVTTTVGALPDLVGTRFGPSDWLTVSAADVESFAHLTGDLNPLHLDADFAAGTPFGAPIAHGLLTLSLVVPLLAEVLVVTEVGMGVNYGFNRVRFPAAVPVDSRIRLTGEIVAVSEVPGGYQAEVTVTIERESEDKPACVAELVLRYYR